MLNSLNYKLSQDSKQDISKMYMYVQTSNLLLSKMILELHKPAKAGIFLICNL